MLMNRFLTLLLASIMVLASGCKPTSQIQQMSPGAAASGSAQESSSVMTDSVNYMHERGLKYTLYDLSKTPPTAIGGAIVYMLGSGGEKGCCIALPKTWRPGIKVRVQWHESDRTQIYPQEYNRDLEVPRYDQPADLYVVFHSKNEVELVVSQAEPGHPEWQGRIKQTPWEHCLAGNERKVCKAALPKMFDTSARGVCTYFKREKLADADVLCATLMKQCMDDFEDKSYCESILWGEFKE